MKRFVFPLERIRAWNATKLQLEETALESLLERQRRAEAAYAEVCAQRVEFEHFTLNQPVIHSGELARIEQFRQFVAAEGKRTQFLLADLARQIAERRLAVIEIKRKIELLDRLRARQKDAWTAEETKELQAAADEAFLQKLVAGRRG